jgi:serine/threonine protein kinase
MPEEWNLKKGEKLRNRYTVKSLIAEGGIGKTYLAEDSATNKDVVLKALNFNKLKNWKELELFKREVEVLKNIDYPLIPDYYDYFESDHKGQKLFILAQEFVNGSNLYQHVKNGKHFSAGEVKEILKTMLTTLDYIHNLRPPVVHRDINPKNIIMDNQKRVFLVDFGAVGHIIDNTIAASKSDTFVGTIGYMPPEQLYGKAAPASDLYSLGVSILFLLSGKEPSEFKLKDLKLEYSIHVDVPDALVRLIDKMIEPNIDKRVQSAREALRILEGGEAAIKAGKADIRLEDIDDWVDQKLVEQRKITERKEKEKRTVWEKNESREQERIRKASATPRRVFIIEEGDKSILRVEKISFFRMLRVVFKNGFLFCFFISIGLVSFILPIYYEIKLGIELTGMPLDFIINFILVTVVIFFSVFLIYFLKKNLSKTNTFHILITEKNRMLLYFKNPVKPFYVGHKNDLKIDITEESYGPGNFLLQTRAWKSITFQTSKKEWTEHGFKQSDTERIRTFIKKHAIKEID